MQVKHSPIFDKKVYSVKLPWVKKHMDKVNLTMGFSDNDYEEVYRIRIHLANAAAYSKPFLILMDLSSGNKSDYCRQIKYSK